jgi:hypothetical protein
VKLLDASFEGLSSTSGVAGDIITLLGCRASRANVLQKDKGPAKADPKYLKTGAPGRI